MSKLFDIEPIRQMHESISLARDDEDRYYFKKKNQVKMFSVVFTYDELVRFIGSRTISECIAMWEKERKDLIEHLEKHLKKAVNEKDQIRISSNIGSIKGQGKIGFYVASKKDYSQSSLLNEKLAMSCCHGTSFSPEERGKSLIAGYNEDLKRMRDFIFQYAGDESQSEYDRFEINYAKRYNAWLYAKSNCVSTMISGPSGFNVSRAKKTNRSESKKLEELVEFYEKVKRVIRKKYTDSGVISSDDPKAIEKLQKKLENMEKDRDNMKAVNAAWRKYKGKKADKSALYKLGFDDEGIDAIEAGMEPYEHKPHGTYTFSNLGANIRRVKGRIEKLRRESKRVEKELDFGYVIAIQNVKANRIQLVFPEKPCEGIRSLLKKNAFRWSPKNEAWQRQLTNNAVDATHKILPEIEKLSD